MRTVATGYRHLRTERLQLQPLEPGDARALFAIMRAPSAMAHWDHAPLQDAESAIDILAAQLAQMQAGQGRYWSVRRQACEPAIGFCDLSDIDGGQRRAEVGFLFHPDVWGHGYAQEAMAAIIAHSFSTTVVERLWARLHAGNDACARLLARLGFSYEGRLRGHVLREGRRIDCLIYGLLKKD